MQGKTYREKIHKVVNAVLRAHVPSIPKAKRVEIGYAIAGLIHAKLYGAYVDNIESPIWRDLWIASGECDAPTKTAEQILNELVI